MRSLPKIGRNRLRELDKAWKQKQPDWCRKRLQVIKLIAQHELTSAQIAEAVDISRRTVFNYLNRFEERGVEGLLERSGVGGSSSEVITPEVELKLQEGLSKGKWRRAIDVQNWLLTEHGKTLSLKGIYYWLGKVGGVLKVPRKTHIKKDAAQAEAFRNELSSKLQEVSKESKRPVRIWVSDEHRYGLLPVIRRCWSLRGIRPVVPYKTKYKWGYLYTALEVDGAHSSEFFFSPTVNLDVTEIFLKQISESDPDSDHIIIWDNAGFHQKSECHLLPENIKILPLPSYSPELNPVEKVGDSIKDKVCNKVYDTLHEIEEAILQEINRWRKSPENLKQLVSFDWLQIQVNNSGAI